MEPPPPALAAQATKNLDAFPDFPDADAFQSPAEDVLNDISESYRAQEEKGVQERSEPETISSRSICIAPELKTTSMPGILAVIRELEQRFGPVCEFRTIRDKDSLTDFLKAVFVKFHDKDSIRKIQDELRGAQVGTIMIGAPPEWDRLKELDGGVSLEDVQDLLRPGSAQMDVVEENPQDRAIGEAVDSVERALESTHTEVEGREGQDDVANTVAPSPASVNTCECRIEIFANDFENEPSGVRDRPRFLKSSAQRAHVARSLVNWGGFYPHYRFGAQAIRDAEQASDEKATEETSELTEEEKERAKTILIATRDMREMMLRYRRKLRDLGEPDHGLSTQDGKEVVLDWEKQPEAEVAEIPAADTPAQMNSVPQVVQATLERPKSAKPRAKKPKKLTPEEEESLARLFSQSDLLRAHVDLKAKSPSAKTESEPSPSDSIPPLATSPPPRSQSEASIATPPKSQHEQQNISSKATSAVSNVSREEQAAMVENNRTRRARRIAEQDRTGFKAKLLGWLGR